MIIPIFAVKHPAPDHGDGGRSTHHGQKVDGPEATLELHLGIEQQSHQQGQDDAHRHGEDTEEDGVPGSFPELGGLEHLDVVVNAS